MHGLMPAFETAPLTSAGEKYKKQHPLLKLCHLAKILQLKEHTSENIPAQTHEWHVYSEHGILIPLPQESMIMETMCYPYYLSARNTLCSICCFAVIVNAAQ